MIWYVQVQYYYTLGLSLNSTRVLLYPENSDIVLPKLAPSQPAPCYPKITTRAKTPTSCEILTHEMPVIPLNRKNHLKSVGGTFVTHPTFWTSASQSCFTPSHRPLFAIQNPVRHNLSAPAAKPHPPLSVTSALPSRSLFPDDVVHRNSSTSLVHLPG